MKNRNRIILQEKYHKLRIELQETIRLAHYAYVHQLDDLAAEKKKREHKGEDEANLLTHLTVQMSDLLEKPENQIIPKETLFDDSITLITNFKGFLQNRNNWAKLSHEELHGINILLERAHAAVTGIPSSIDNDDELRNINSFEYLYALSAYIPESLRQRPYFKEVRALYDAGKHYDSSVAYGDLYTHFQLALQEYIEQDIHFTTKAFTQLEAELNSVEKQREDNTITKKRYQLKRAELDSQLAEFKQFDKLVITVFANQNAALSRSWGTAKTAVQSVRQTNHASTKKAVTSSLSGSSRKINKIAPREGEKLGNKIKINYTGDMVTSAKTNQPSKIVLSHHMETDREQLRFGTTGQVYFGDDAHINPIFIRFLEAKKRQRAGKTLDDKATRIQHVYINNLVRKTNNVVFDCNPFSSVRREKEITEKLENLNQLHDNIAVITLPTNGGFLAESVMHQRKNNVSAKDAFNQMLAIAEGKGKTDAYQNDFYISDDIKTLLYKNTTEHNKLSKLLEESFAEMGVSQTGLMSPAERQAVFFHFVKFKLTDFVLNTLNPESFNISCKDAIDRGSVSTTYYALMQSIDRKHPISRDEFEELLHGPAITVKARGMNDYIMSIWSAVDAWIKGQDRLVAGSPHKRDVPAWLRAWHKDNAIDGQYALAVTEENTERNKEVISNLKQYIKIITNDKSTLLSSCFFFSRYYTDKQGLDRDWKKQAATKVLHYLEHHTKGATLILCDEEVKALKDGRLSQCFKNTTSPINLETVIAPLHDKHRTCGFGMN